MPAMTRREAREEALRLLFETGFHGDETPETIYQRACEDREFENLPYIRTVYFGVLEHQDELDELIARHSSGWRPDRIAPVTRCILRLSVFEMLYVKDVPLTVALNEAIELVKKYDEEKLRAFVNGVLNGVKQELEQRNPS